MSGLVGRKGCGIGCAAALIIVVALAGTTFLSINHRYGRAFDARERLAERHGARSAFDPGAGPALPPERLERFLAVRRALMPACAKLAAGSGALLAIQPIEDASHAPKQQVVRTSVQAILGGFRQMMNLGDFATVRNVALLEQDMGTGEYFWTYALVYYAALGEQPQLGVSPDEPGGLTGKVRRDLESMLRRRAQALAETGSDEAAGWTAAADRLQDTLRGNPFPDGPPPGVAAAVEPRGVELARFWCRDSDPLEFMRLKAVWAGVEDE